MELLIKLAVFKKPIFVFLKDLTRINQKPLDIDALLYYEELQQVKVSKVSNFSDNLWNLNSSEVNTKHKEHVLKIDFRNFPDISETVIFEMKCIALLWLTIGKIGVTSKKSHKDTTIIGTVKEVLSFLNKVFSHLNEDYSIEFIRDKKIVLSDLHESDLAGAVIKKKIVKNHTITDFFNSKIQDEKVIELIIGSPFLIFKENNFMWAPSSRDIKSRLDLLPNKVFEESVTNASILVIDFLQKMELPINDKVTISRKNVIKTKLCPKKYAHITKEHVDAYRVLRLSKSGYNEEFIAQYPIPQGLISLSGHLYSFSRQTKNYWDHSDTPKLNDVKNYLRLIRGASIFIFLAFTGMRSSELTRIILDNWSMTTGVKDGVITEPIPQISSLVSKGRDDTHGLFTDKWVLIPIVVDGLGCLEYISTYTQNRYLFSSITALNAEESLKARPTAANLSWVLNPFLSSLTDLVPSVHTLRDTLAYQMFRIDLGLPFISYQLKHMVDLIEKETSLGTVSNVTLGYGDIGMRLSKDGRIKQQVEIEKVKANYDPDGSYYGGKGKEHKSKMIKLFQGYIEAGYTKSEVFEVMAEQGLGLIDVGGALCYGDRAEEFDPTLPCVGSLRCNPVRCKNSTITSSHIPRWKEIYLSNKVAIDSGLMGDNKEAALVAMNEAKLVLDALSENVEEQV